MGFFQRLFSKKREPESLQGTAPLFYRHEPYPRDETGRQYTEISGPVARWCVQDHLEIGQPRKKYRLYVATPFGEFCFVETLWKPADVMWARIRVYREPKESWPYHDMRLVELVCQYDPA